MGDAVCEGGRLLRVCGLRVKALRVKASRVRADLRIEWNNSTHQAGFGNKEKGMRNKE